MNICYEQYSTLMIQTKLIYPYALKDRFCTQSSAFKAHFSTIKKNTDYHSLFRLLLVASVIIYAKEGYPVTLTCPVKTHFEPFTWRGPRNLTIYSIGNKCNPYLPQHDNIAITGDHSAGEYKLKLQQYTLSAAGHYQCDIVVNGKPAIFDIIVRTAGKTFLRYNNILILQKTLKSQKSGTPRIIWVYCHNIYRLYLYITEISLYSFVHCRTTFVYFCLRVLYEHP